MRILITSGGTIVKIDDVRYIGNFSTGSFPAKLATSALSRGHEVCYLHAINAKLPIGLQGKLKLVSYETYDDYVRELKNLLEKNKFDVVLLGAAVSDYGVRQQPGKISSFKPSLILHLFRLPKVIKSIKKYSKFPFFQVGFKLLSDVSDEQLIDVAYKAGLENHSDLVIANDLSKIRAGRGEVILVTPEKGAIKLKEPGLADKIIQFIEKRSVVTHLKTLLIHDKDLTVKYKKEITLFKKFCRLLSDRRLMTDFFVGSKAGHGSLALRVEGNSFLITTRSSNKKNLKTNNVVLVKKVDWKNKKIFVVSSSDKKASFNAVLVAAIFDKFPNINVVVHTHSFVQKAPTTVFPYSPGTIEYAIEPLKLFNKNSKVINLKDHGLIAIGDDLKTTVEYVLR